MQTKEYRRNYYIKNRDKIIARSIIYQLNIINNKIFYCHDHNISYSNIHRLKKHLNGYKHDDSKYVSYICTPCNYKSKFKQSYNRHMTTTNHIRNMLDEPD